MESLFLGNLGSPPLLFFFLGAAAAALRSDLEIPAQIAKFLSLYLLFAIGFKGGVALSESEINTEVVVSLAAAVVLATIIPFGVFFALRRRCGPADAAAVAATYGSISAVTFVTATSYLDAVGVEWQGHLVAAMALMESPAIVVGLVLYQIYGHPRADGEPAGFDWRGILRESALNGSVLLIVGSLLIGWVTGPQGMSQVSPLVQDLFIGMLCLFLLDMGVVAARRLRELRRGTGGESSGLGWMVVFGLGLPLVNAVLAGTVAWQLDMSEGDALLLTVLGASASYIAVPAAMRLALPEANPSIYLSMSLGITFPFNLLVGIPLYHQVLRYVLGSG